jgi:hypothetical protein
MLKETLVVLVGEFGRTPKIGPSSVNDPAQRTGRDHWAGVFSAVFAGSGVRGGQAIGRTDKIGAYPAMRGYYPSDLGATIHHVLGVEPASEVCDQLGRSLQLNRRRSPPRFSIGQPLEGSGTEGPARIDDSRLISAPNMLVLV